MTFDDVEDIDKFIECSEGLEATILINPRNPDIKKLLYAGFGKPKLVDQKLSLTRIPGKRFQYLRDAVIPHGKGKSLPFSPDLLAELDRMRRSTIEWGGMFVFVKEMKMASQRKGSEGTVNVGMELSKYMYHNHPFDDWFPYTIYSTQDMKRYIFDAARYRDPRKDYLITTTGLFSLQIHKSLVDLYRKNPVVQKMIAAVHQHMVDNIMVQIRMTPEVKYVALYEMVDAMNRLDGAEAILAIIDNGLFSADELRELDKISQRLININRFYWVNYKEWKSIRETGFVDTLYVDS